MKYIVPWLGVLAIVVWVGTIFTLLTMMWHPDWMPPDNPPPAETLTVRLYMGAVGLGLVLGPALFFKAVRAQLHILQQISYGIAFALAVFSVWGTLF